MKHLLAILLILHSPFFILHLEATTARLGSIKATEYVVTAESDATAMAYATAVSNKLESGKQATLVSGTNIKTVNNLSLLGSGNITIEGGGSLPANYLQPATNYTDAATNAAVASAKAYADAAVVAATNGISAARITDGTNTLTAAREWTKVANEEIKGLGYGEWQLVISNYNGVSTYNHLTWNDKYSFWGTHTKEAVVVTNGEIYALLGGAQAEGRTTFTGYDNPIGPVSREGEFGNWCTFTYTPTTVSTTNTTLLATTNEVAAVASAVAAKRDVTNNVCAADSYVYSAWSKENLPSGVTWDDQPYMANDGLWTWHYTDGSSEGYSQGDQGANDNDTLQTFGYGDGFTSTRTKTAVAASNELFVTYSFVTNVAGKGGASISTNAVDALIASYDATNLTARINAKAGKITDAVYDFNYGTNFTRRLYETLTNLIDRFGGTVTNAPTFN